MFLTGSQNSRSNNIPKQQKTTRKQDAKQKYNIVIQNETREQAE